MKKCFFHPKNRHLKRLFSDKRAVSVALSTLIISSVVVAAGISVLYWAYAWGTVANNEYSQTVISNQNATSERLAFEYVSFDSGKLTIYAINCGQVDDIAAVRVYLWNNAGQILGTYPTETSPVTELRYTNNHQLIPGNVLDKGEEGYFSVDNLNLPSGYYTLRVATERGRNFDASVNVP